MPISILKTHEMYLSLPDQNLLHASFLEEIKDMLNTNNTIALLSLEGLNIAWTFVNQAHGIVCSYVLIHYIMIISFEKLIDFLQGSFLHMSPSDGEVSPNITGRHE